MGKLIDLLEGMARHISPDAPVSQRATYTAGAVRWNARDLYESDSGEASADRSVAHWACKRVLCTALASLPVDQVRYRSDQSRELMPLSPVVRQPANTVGRKQWVFQVMESWLDDGNVYGDVVADSRGLPTIVETRSPSTVQWRPVDGTLVPFTGGEQRVLWPRGDLWHVPCFLKAGSPIGLSPSEVASQSVSTSVAAQKYAADYFRAGGHPIADIEISDPNATDAQVAAIKARAKAATRNREPFAHTSSVKWTPITVSADSGQVVNLQRFECEQAARIYGVPPIMIYAAVSGSSVTYANATQEDLAFLKHSLRWWVNLLQDAWSEFLPVPQVVRLNVDSFLQMTSRERAEVHEIRLRTKTRTVDEVRALEDEPPFGGVFAEPGIPPDDLEPVEPFRSRAEDIHLHAAPVTVNVPEQTAPLVVTDAPVPVVNVPEQRAPEITVNVPEQAAPTVTVNVPEQPAPVVNFNMPEPPPPAPPAPRRKMRRTIERDKQGRITAVVEED